MHILSPLFNLTVADKLLILDYPFCNTSSVNLLSVCNMQFHDFHRYFAYSFLSAGLLSQGKLQKGLLVSEFSRQQLQAVASPYLPHIPSANWKRKPSCFWNPALLLPLQQHLQPVTTSFTTANSITWKAGHLGADLALFQQHLSTSNSLIFYSYNRNKIGRICSNSQQTSSAHTFCTKASSETLHSLPCLPRHDHFYHNK